MYFVYTTGGHVYETFHSSWIFVITSYNHFIQNSNLCNSGLKQPQHFQLTIIALLNRQDTYATELYAFVCRETEIVNLFVKFYQFQAEYQQQVCSAIQNSLPTLSNTLGKLAN